MPENLRDWAVLSAFVITVAAALANEREIMAVGCVATLILVITGKGK
jgi:hypothetical protein